MNDCLEAVKGVVPVVESWGGVGSLAETREWAKKGTVAANAPEDHQVDDGQARVDFADSDSDLSEPEEVPLDPAAIMGDLGFDTEPNDNQN